MYSPSFYPSPLYYTPSLPHSEPTNIPSLLTELIRSIVHIQDGGSKVFLTDSVGTASPKTWSPSTSNFERFQLSRRYIIVYISYSLPYSPLSVRFIDKPCQGHSCVSIAPYYSFLLIKYSVLLMKYSSFLLVPGRPLGASVLTQSVFLVVNTSLLATEWKQKIPGFIYCCFLSSPVFTAFQKH